LISPMTVPWASPRWWSIQSAEAGEPLRLCAGKNRFRAIFRRRYCERSNDLTPELDQAVHVQCALDRGMEWHQRARQRWLQWRVLNFVTGCCCYTARNRQATVRRGSPGRLPLLLPNGCVPPDKRRRCAPAQGYAKQHLQLYLSKDHRTFNPSVYDGSSNNIPQDEQIVGV
jgi:hypothetical protein